MELKVCIGSACHVKGSYNVISAFQQIIEEYSIFNEVELKAVFCLGHCMDAVSVQINEEAIYSVSGESARNFFKQYILPRLENVNKA